MNSSICDGENKMVTISMQASICRTNPDDIKKLPEILKAHSEWLKDPRKGKIACLKDMDLHEADLSGANLSNALFSSCKFLGTDFR